MSGRGLRIVFMGTPDFAASALQKLVDSSHTIVAVYSQPPRPKGRGQQVQKSPVHMLAEKNGLPVFTPKNFKEEQDLHDFTAHEPDVAVVAAYGLILPQAILDTPRYGCLNIHASLLPRWRGAAPIHRAILAGDEKTGVTIMQMEAGLDTGPMIAVEEAVITPQTSTGVLHDTLSAVGADMILKVLDQLSRNGTVTATLQPDDGVIYADKISKEEARIDWHQSAAQLDRQVRAFAPVPGAWCQTENGQRLKILSAHLIERSSSSVGKILNAQGDVACGEGVLRLVCVQPEGKKPMDIADAFNGGYIIVGDHLT